jgi:signal peptide peptidase SppA
MTTMTASELTVNYDALRVLVGDVWCLVPSVHAQLMAGIGYSDKVLEVMAHGEGGESAMEVVALRDQRTEHRQEGVAVLALHGVMVNRSSWLTRYGIAVSTEEFGALFDAAATDTKVTAIVLDINSPGGSAHGLRELSNKIRGARDPSRPIIAVANPHAHSAAYWVASAADRVIMAPSAMAGSIGVLWVHVEFSGMDEENGITRTAIYRGTHKADVTDFKPLEADGKQELQEHVDGLYAQFVGDVATNRGTDAATVERDFGQGRSFIDETAVKVGLADGVGTLEQVVAQLLGSNKEGSKSGGPGSENEVLDLVEMELHSYARRV